MEEGSLTTAADIRERNRRCPARISPRRRRSACRCLLVSRAAAASIGTNLYGYAYDTIGNRLWAAENTATNSYTANSLNQYTSVAGGTNIVYDADGNLTNDGIFFYSYDAENRLVAAYPLSPVVGSLAVLNRYDHRHRRVQKIVKQYDGTTWGTIETHTFVWDGNNIVLEKVEFANGTTRTFEYFWGADKSGTEQGAGGVEGLLAISIDGVFYIPCYDHNGNIFLYVSENGSIAAQYTYDPYGNITDMSGALATQFSFGFSTKYHERELGLVSYQRRFYRPDLGRWLNRDPIEEEGGENLYCFVENSPSDSFDEFGLFKWNIGRTKILKDLGLMGTLTTASQMSDTPPKEVGANILATTGVDWSISVICACKSNNKWGAEDAIGNFTPVVHLRSSYAPLGKSYSTSNFENSMVKGEYDHVNDLLEWANGNGTIEVEQFIQRNSNRRYASKQDCEASLTRRLSSHLSADISIAILQSQLKWDTSKKHTVNIP